MCGRFYVPLEDDDFDFQAILDQIKANDKDPPLLSEMNRGEIFPSFIVPAVTGGSPALMKWGFSRFDGKGLVINARLETAPEKPMFRGPYENGRCLIPASHYFEWRKDGAARQKFAIGTGAPITMAGLFRSEPGVPLPLFVILTRPAAPGITFIHDRMPVIVPEQFREEWLSGRMDAREILKISEENMKYRDAI